MIAEGHKGTYLLMISGEERPIGQVFITLNDAVKWVVNRMVETEKHTSKDKPCKFHLHADYSKLKYQDKNEGANNK